MKVRSTACASCAGLCERVNHRSDSARIYSGCSVLPVSLACQARLDTWLCRTFRLTIVLFNHQVFGGVAIVAALLNLVRPSVVLVAVALAAAAFGVVLHNPDLSALAAGILILSLARPAPVPG